MHNRTAAILLLLTLATLVTAAGPPAEPPDPLEQAKQLADGGQYEQAEQMYQAILAEQAGPDQALAAQKGLAILYVRSGQGAQAKQALEDLIAGFSDHWDVARAVTHVADACRDTGKHNDALETYRRVIAAWPDDEHALWSQMGMAISQACLKDAEASDAALEELCTTWQGHHHLGRALCIVADNSRRLNSHEKARDIYTRALASSPDLEFAMWSRMGLAISEIRLGDVESAEADADRLISDFVGDPRVSIAACLAADQFRAVGANEKAAELYKYVVDIWPQTEHAIWSQMGLAIIDMRLGDQAATDADAERLVTNFADRENLGQAVEQVVHQYELRRQFDKAQQLCQRAIAAQADRDSGPLAKANIARLHIRAGNDQAAEQLLEGLLTSRPDDPQLPEAINRIAEGYYQRARRLHLEYRRQIGRVDYAVNTTEQGRPPDVKHYFRKAIEKWDIIIDQMGENDSVAPIAYTFAGYCYWQLGDPVKALQYFMGVPERYPDYEHADFAQNMVYRTLRKLHSRGLLTHREALPLMLEASQALLDRYPDSEYAPVAREAVERISATLARWREKEARDGQ